MKIFKDPVKFQAWSRGLRRSGKKVALVPTMGYLHEGHISLVEAAKRKGADEIVVSIFVNPVQFGPNEDFEKYPRDEKADLKKCRAAGVSAVFLPEPATMYKDGHSVYVDEGSLSKGLCGEKRPGHFRGVCTVVAKLFNLAHPDFAVFGQKDFQQAQVIKRMVRDLNFDLEIVVAPIVREASGLAKSSRNTYLSEKEREMATEISAGLAAFRTVASLRKRLEKAGLKVDYIECVDSQTLEKVKRPGKGTAILVAAYAGSTRLIDNRVL
jgi:pantoate--beta-alanine ligase